MPLKKRKAPKDKRIIVAFTGLTGSGKSTACNFLASKGYNVIDVDAFAHGLYAKGKSLNGRLVKRYGKKILDKNGDIKRPFLRRIAFKDIKSYRKFTKIIFPVLNRALNSELSTLNSKLIILDMAVLYESGFYKKADNTIFISTDEKKRMKRVKSGVNKAIFRKVSEFQRIFPVPKKIALSTFILYNNKTKKVLYNNALKIIKKCLRGVNGTKGTAGKNR